MTEFTVTVSGTYTLSLGTPAETNNNFFSTTVRTRIPSNINTSYILITNNRAAGPRSATLNVGTSYYLIAAGSASCTSTTYPTSYNVTLAGPGDIIGPTIPIIPSQTTEIGNQPVFRDGRINNYDTSNPVVVYPIRDENNQVSIHIYSDTGVLLLVISAEQIANTPENPDNNIIIAEDGGISFARIHGDGQGFWQVTAPQYNGKTYVLIFSELYANAGYTSYEE